MRTEKYDTALVGGLDVGVFSSGTQRPNLIAYDAVRKDW